MSQTRRFINELGNEIEIVITDVTENGDEERVRICLTGPTSISENIVTPMEAHELLSALSMHLNRRVSK